MFIALVQGNLKPTVSWKGVGGGVAKVFYDKINKKYMLKMRLDTEEVKTSHPSLPSPDPLPEPNTGLRKPNPN